MAAYHILIETSHKTVLTVSQFAPAITHLAKIVPSSKAYYEIPGDTDGPGFPLANSDGASYPKWSWNARKRKFYETNPRIVTSEIVDLAVLVNAKRDALVRIIVDIARKRLAVSNGIFFQETIYSMKREQALAFKRDRAADDAVADYPFVAQHAEIAGLTPQQAADDILFAASLSEEILLRTEGLRLKYYKKIKESKTPGDVDRLWIQYQREAILNSLR